MEEDSLLFDGIFRGLLAVLYPYPKYDDIDTNILGAAKAEVGWNHMVRPVSALLAIEVKTFPVPGPLPLL